MAESTTIARPYAKAAFESALASEELGRWSDMLRMLAVITAQEPVIMTLLSPAMAAAQQAEMLFGLCGSELTPNAQNFVRLLAENKRLTLCGEISGLFEILKAEQEKTVDVELTTAFELNPDVVKQISKSLQTRLKKQIKLQTRVDQNLIGGAVIRAGDSVIDSSVRGKLTKLAEAMNA
jgi:F-type H+-transporting ATPase subunit delta